MGFKCIQFECSTLSALLFFIKKQKPVGNLDFSADSSPCATQVRSQYLRSKSAKHPVARSWAATRAVPAVLVPALATEGSRLGVGSSGDFFREKGHLRP